MDDRAILTGTDLDSDGAPETHGSPTESPVVQPGSNQHILEMRSANSAADVNLPDLVLEDETAPGHQPGMEPSEIESNSLRLSQDQLEELRENLGSRISDYPFAGLEDATPQWIQELARTGLPSELAQEPVLTSTTNWGGRLDQFGGAQIYSPRGSNDRADLIRFKPVNGYQMDPEDRQRHGFRQHLGENGLRTYRSDTLNTTIIVHPALGVLRIQQGAQSWSREF